MGYKFSLGSVTRLSNSEETPMISAMLRIVTRKSDKLLTHDLLHSSFIRHIAENTLNIITTHYFIIIKGNDT